MAGVAAAPSPLYPIPAPLRATIVRATIVKDRLRLAALLLVLAAAATTAYVLESADPADQDRPMARNPAHAAAPLSRADQVAAWTADILARPLIYPGRRAPSPAPTASQQAAAEPTPRLTGVIVGPTQRRALFTTGPGSRPIAVQEGARIGPYFVRSIRANEVVVDGPDGTRALHPAYDNAPQPNLPQPGTPALLPNRAALARSFSPA